MKKMSFHYCLCSVFMLCLELLCLDNSVAKFVFCVECIQNKLLLNHSLFRIFKLLQIMNTDVTANAK
jgi:hypothetical protein